MFKRQPVYLRAQDAIKSYIEQHRLEPGAPLPSEAMLAQELGTSRASLREGIKSLEALGIVEVRRGEGLFVKAFSFDSIFNNLPYSFAVDGRSLRELTQVRSALEEGLMWMVAECVDEGTIQRLEKIVHEMGVRANQGESFEAHDRTFHRELYAPLGNPFVVRLVDLFWEIFHRLHGEETLKKKALLRSVMEHRAIVETLKQRDGWAAAVAMRQHFADIRKRVS
ncbi:FadR/GntR family transcriptional regulator [Calidithermus timidus]|uniref:FadR/GntR family transcriptional regulator n=1 Tax=Calidithermus timidus TaxID=307124 RepID=UPI000593E541|nr:FadR/GntR family transcriptional regulator [Calidithermus timidus]